MKKTLNQYSSLERISIDLPVKRFSLKSHLKNIDYGIELLRTYGNEYVIGYRLMRGWGTREKFHEIILLGQAEELRKSDERYKYATLDSLLEKKEEIREGKYKLSNNGLIIGLDPCYSR